MVAGDIIDIVGNPAGETPFENGMILTNSKDIALTAVFKNYRPITTPVNVINEKSPIAVGASILGSIKKANSQLSTVLAQRSAMFFSREELVEYLREKGELSQKDIDAIVAVEGDSIVFNYAKEPHARKFDERLGKVFGQAI